METIGLTLKDSEQSFFQELFSYYDKDNLGKIQGQKIVDLFRSSQLPTEKLDHIAELCGAKRLGHFGRSQFYIALKLVAAAQNGLPLKPETFSSGMEIPLPRFGISQETNQAMNSATTLDGVVILDGIGNSATTKGNASLENNIPQYSKNPLPNTQIQYQVLSAGAGLGETDSQNSSPCEQLPSPKDRNLWTSFTHEEHRLVESDHDHLLGNEEGESSERHSSDDENEVWTITSEQETYYTEQFTKMQPDVVLKISGSVAKDFFEKSKLPVQELSKIWQLSDIDKDGALSLAEFCTAMHLVVLRRNNINLPEKLPLSLVPKLPFQIITPESQQPPSVVPQKLPLQQLSSSEFQSKNSKPTSPSEQLSPQNKEWTKFQQSPTSTVSSPGAKPVNFDFSAASVEQDPQILHPVAVRLTPDFQPVAVTHELEIGEKSTDTADGVLQTPHFSSSGELLDPSQQQIQGLVNQFSANLNLASNNAAGALPILQGPKKEPPPPPPPRPRRNHTRSSSLDLNRIGKNEPQFLHSGIPPAVPPRVSPSGAGAFEVYRKPATTGSKTTSSLSLDLDFVASTSMVVEQNQFVAGPTVDAVPSGTLPIATGVVGPESASAPPLELEKKRYSSAPSVAASASDVLHEKRELQVTIRMHREKNTQLVRLNTELDQELSDIMAERIALEIQLEHMKNSSSS